MLTGRSFKRWLEIGIISNGVKVGQTFRQSGVFTIKETWTKFDQSGFDSVNMI